MRSSRRPRHRRYRAQMTPAESYELAACLFVVAIILGLLGGPLLFFVTHHLGR